MKRRGRKPRSKYKKMKEKILKYIGVETITRKELIRRLVEDEKG